MIPPQVLGELSRLHELMTRLVEDLPADQVNRRPLPELPPLGWLLGRSVYLETYWLREVLSGDADLTGRVRHLFGHGVEPQPALDAALPPRDHLLNWALEIQDTHLSRLANPGERPDHPLLRNGWLPAWLTQVHARLYERMLAVLNAQALAQDTGSHQVRTPLQAASPATDYAQITQGHYRIGARDGVVFDNELPAQVVELSSYRIARRPVSNAAYLAFMEAGGYTDAQRWDKAGLAWLQGSGARHPWHWRQNAAGHWYSVGVNGPADLIAADPVSGLSAHEADAYVRWAATAHPELGGAVLQHEYQWETAARLQAIRDYGRAWEWCANGFAPYDRYQAPEDPEMATAEFDGHHRSLRGGCLHTQPGLRRASYRHCGRPQQRHLFAGLRLVLPPL